MNALIRLCGIGLLGVASWVAGCASHADSVRCEGRLTPINAAGRPALAGSSGGSGTDSTAPDRRRAGASRRDAP